MSGHILTLGAIGALAAASVAAGRHGSRAMQKPTDTTALVVGQTDRGLPALVLVDLAVVGSPRTEAELRACTTCILGYIALDHPQAYEERGHVDCADKDGLEPLQISYAAAQPGWGPLTYDAALWVARDEANNGQTNGYLMPDRNNVFFGARKVWRFYLDHRKADVASRWIVPSCTHHGDTAKGERHPVLDRMYKAKANAPGFRPMFELYARGAELTETLAARFNTYDETIQDAFLAMGARLFGQRIGNTP